MKNIIDKTLEILSANSEWQERYEGYLSDIWSNPDKINKGFKKPQVLSVTVIAETIICVSKGRTLERLALEIMEA